MAIIKCPKCGRQISDKGSICPGCMTPLSDLFAKKTAPQLAQKSLTTAAGMYEYCKLNNLGCGTSKSWDLKHLQLIADALSPDEKVLTVFLGLYNYTSPSQHDMTFAYAITNKRFILAQKKMIGSVFQTISLDNVNDVTLNKSFLKGIVTVDTIKETFNVKTANTKSAECMYNAIHSALEKAKGSASGSSNATQGNMTAQLSELKNLLNAGLITARDYEAKKKQILGL